MHKKTRDYLVNNKFSYRFICKYKVYNRLQFVKKGNMLQNTNEISILDFQINRIVNINRWSEL